MSKYRIELEHETYTYRSYMACEDNGPDDCVGTRVRFRVYSGNRKLKVHDSERQAKEHITRLKKKGHKV